MLDPTQAVDRRSALKLLATGVVSTAGCLESHGSPTPSTNPDTGTTTEATNDTHTNQSSVTKTRSADNSPALPEYMDWVYAPGLYDPTWPFSESRISPKAQQQYGEHLNDETSRLMHEFSDFPIIEAGLDPHNIEEVISTTEMFIALGDFSQREIDKDVTEPSPYKRKTPEYHGYLLYSHSEEPFAIGAKDGVVIAVKEPGKLLSSLEVVKRLIDTKRGAAKRLDQDFEYAGQLARWVGTHTYTVMEHIPEENYRVHKNIRGNGVGLTFTDDGIEARYVSQFTESTEITDDLLDEHINQSWPKLNDWTDRTRRTIENIAVIDGHVTYDSALKND